MATKLTLLTNSSAPVIPADRPRIVLEPIKSLLNDWFILTEKKYEEGLVTVGSRSFRIGSKVHSTLRAGEICWFFSAPQLGATASLLKIIDEYLQIEKPVLYANPVIERSKFAARLIASHTGLPLDYLNNGTLFVDDWPKLTMSASQLMQNVFFSDNYHPDELSLWRNNWPIPEKADDVGLFIFDDYLEMEKLDVGRLEKKGAELRELSIGCGAPIIASVRLHDLDHFYRNLKVCNSLQTFDRLQASGPILSLFKIGTNRYLNFLSCDRRVNGSARIELQPNSGSIRYVY